MLAGSLQNAGVEERPRGVGGTVLAVGPAGKKGHVARAVFPKGFQGRQGELLVSPALPAARGIHQPHDRLAAADQAIRAGLAAHVPRHGGQVASDLFRRAFRLPRD